MYARRLFAYRKNQLGFGPTPSELFVIAVLICIVVAPIASYIGKRASRRRCQERLTEIHALTEKWAAASQVREQMAPIWSDLLSIAEEVPRKCPSGAEYVLQPAGQSPVCASGRDGHGLDDG